MPKLSINNTSIERKNENVYIVPDEPLDKKNVYNQIQTENKNIVKLRSSGETVVNVKKGLHSSTSEVLKSDYAHDENKIKKKKDNDRIFTSEETEQTETSHNILESNGSTLPLFEKTSLNESCRNMRMEKKRKREMQRRSNVNKELDKLTALIMALNPPELMKPAHGEKSDFISQPPLNRLELIQVAVKVLERLSCRSIKDTEKIAELTAEVTTLRQRLGKDDVTMMFPIMVPSGQQTRTGDPIPNNAISISPRIPYHLMNAGSLPAIYNAPPYPPNCYMHPFPNVQQVKDINNNSQNSTNPTFEAQSNVILFPDFNRYPFNNEFENKQTSDMQRKHHNKS